MAARALGAGGGQARAPGTPTAPPALPPPWEGPSKPQLPAPGFSERNKGTADIWHGTEKDEGLTVAIAPGEPSLVAGCALVQL